MPQTPEFLLVIFQRGGADGLCELPFYNDAQMARRMHPGTRVAPPAPPPNQEEEPDPENPPKATFLPQPNQTNPNHPHATGLPPALLGLKPAYDAGKLAFVHATGTLDASRSHFDQQSLMERGEVENPVPSPMQDGFGWLRRHLQTPGLPGYNNPFRGVSITTQPVDALLNGRGYLPIPQPASFSFPTRGATLDPALSQRVQVLQTLYSNAPEPLARAFATDQQAEALVKAAFNLPYGTTAFPASDFGKRVRDAAHMAKHISTLEVVALDIGSWDTHQDQGVMYDPVFGQQATGYMDDLMIDLATSLEAFRQDMVGQRNYCVLVMTEFGRTLDSNGSKGTDHGRGGVCMLMGSRVNGGQVLLPTNFSGLPTTGDLDVGRDIRDIQGEIAIDVLCHPNTSAVLPGLTTWNNPMLIA